MLLYSQNGVQVFQHPYLTLFYVEHWTFGDDSRSYGQSWGYKTVLETDDLEEAKAKVLELLNK